MTLYSRIAGTGSYLPEKKVTNHDLEKLVDTNDSWIVERTGISSRYFVSEHETNAFMSTQAAKHALTAANLESNDIGLIIVATSTPDKLLPSTACLVQEQLNIAHHCPAFDVVAACAGFNYGLSIADQYIKSGSIKSALVIGTEIMTRMIDWSDRTTCILFGDGSGAVVLQASQEPGILSTHLHAAGQYKELLYSPSGLIKGEVPQVKMLGKEVFKVAVNKLGEVLQETLDANNLQSSEIDWLVPHQANLRIIQALAKKLHMSMEQVILTVNEYGNTSAASVPLALDKGVRDGRIKRGQTILLESFGGGFAWGSALIKY